jgi:hypothetical protein
MSAVIKNVLNDDSDPPIIITGGGGAFKATTNAISIDYDEHLTRARKKVRAGTNGAPAITGVTVVVTGASGLTSRSQTLNFLFPFDTYTVNVKYLTGRGITIARQSASKSGSKSASKSQSKSSKGVKKKAASKGKAKKKSK